MHQLLLLLVAFSMSIILVDCKNCLQALLASVDVFKGDGCGTVAVVSASSQAAAAVAGCRLMQWTVLVFIRS